jgi:hypothetical protein
VSNEVSFASRIFSPRLRWLKRGLLQSKEQKTRGRTVRQSNITAARAIADAVRTSLGPKGMDKMVSAINATLVCTTQLGLTGTARRADRVRQRGRHHHQRWRHDCQAHGGSARCSADGSPMA